jgi:hypothetical protein
VGYYGGQIAKFADEHPKVPIMLHFGKNSSCADLANTGHVRG